jgi:hypothetical protein
LRRNVGKQARFAFLIPPAVVAESDAVSALREASRSVSVWV